MVSEYVGADLTVLAAVTAATGDVQLAARLLGAATATSADTGEALPTLVRRRFEHTLSEVRAALEDSEFEAAFAMGRSSPNALISHATSAATDDLQALIDHVVNEPRCRPSDADGSRRGGPRNDAATGSGHSQRLESTVSSAGGRG